MAVLVYPPSTRYLDFHGREITLEECNALSRLPEAQVGLFENDKWRVNAKYIARHVGSWAIRVDAVVTPRTPDSPAEYLYSPVHSQALPDRESCRRAYEDFLVEHTDCEWLPANQDRDSEEVIFVERGNILSPDPSSPEAEYVANAPDPRFGSW